MALTRTQFYEAVQNYLDSTGVDANINATTSTPRWDKTTILTIGGNVMGEEWSGILNQNQTYRAQVVSVTTDSSGRIVIADLTTGSGDTQKVFYRVLSGPTDGNVLYKETDFRSVPLATQQNYQAPWDYLYYQFGLYFQVLPVQAALAMTVAVSYTPPTMDNLATDSSVIDFPVGSEYILVWRTAAKLILKGGGESAAAAALDSLANDARTNMYGSIARLTTRPSYLMFSDSPMHWGSGS